MAERQPSGWQERQKPAMMTRRYDFANYGETHMFLDHLEQLSKRTGYFPDLSFAKTHVNVSVTSREETLGPAEYFFAEQANALALRVVGQTTG